MIRNAGCLSMGGGEGGVERNIGRGRGEKCGGILGWSQEGLVQEILLIMIRILGIWLWSDDHQWVFYIGSRGGGT